MQTDVILQKTTGLNRLFASANDWLSLRVALSNILLSAPTVLITWSLWSVLGN